MVLVVYERILAVLLIVASTTFDNSIATTVTEIVWLPSNKAWFPHNTNQVLILSVEESMKISCPNATDAISGIFLVNETGFNTCSAAEANRYSVTKYTSVVQDAPPFDEHLFTCVGFDTSITFSFNSNSKGRIFYLIDVSNLTKDNRQVLAKEESGGKCLFNGMKVKIRIRDGATTAPVTTSTVASRITDGALNIAATVAGQTRRSAINTVKFAKIPSNQRPGEPNPNGPGTQEPIPSPGQSQSRAMSQTHINTILSLLLIAAATLL